MAWAMAPVEISGFCSREGEGEGGADLQRVRRILVVQVSAADILLGVEGVLVSADSIPNQYCQGWRQLTGFSLGVFLIIRIAPYLSLHRSFGGKPDDNRTTQKDGVGRKIRPVCCSNKVGSYGCALYEDSENLVRVEVGHTGRSSGRSPCASLWRAVCTPFVRTDNGIWHKRVFINDVSLLGNDIKEHGDNKVLSQEISTRVVHIHPSKKDYLDLSTIQGRSLDNLKFDFLTL